MATHSKAHDDHSPLAILTELAVEGTSSLVEAQRTLLDMAQQENDIILGGIKERVGDFVPAAAATDLVRRSLDTLIAMQQDLLTTTSKQTLQWLESEQGGKTNHAAHLVDFAREGVETFSRTQKKFLEAVAQETARMTSGKAGHDGKGLKKTELAHLARDAGNALIEAQKRLLDIMGQQMNVNLDVASRSSDLLSTARLVPMARLTRDEVKNFFDTETSLIGSFIKARKPKAVGRTKKTRRATHRQKAVAV
jgi:hypothetical protein